MGYETASIDPGTNPTIPVATDLVAGQSIQIIKLDIGADGVSSPLGALPGLPVIQAGGILVKEYYDYVGATYPDATTEVYIHRSGGAGGMLVATVTVVYQDSTKAAMVSIART